MAPPAAIEEGALVDDVDTLAHGSDGLGVRLGKASGRAVREGELDHAAMARSQRVQVASFVLKPSPGQNLEFRVLPLRALDLAASGSQFLLREVLAFQKARQIGRAHDQPAIKKLQLALLLQGHSTARMRQLSVVRTEHKGRLATSVFML